jgi:flagellar hook-length control protein FliK
MDVALLAFAAGKKDETAQPTRGEPADGEAFAAAFEGSAGAVGEVPAKAPTMAAQQVASDARPKVQPGAPRIDVLVLAAQTSVGETVRPAMPDAQQTPDAGVPATPRSATGTKTRWVENIAAGTIATAPRAATSTTSARPVEVVKLQSGKARTPLAAARPHPIPVNADRASPREDGPTRTEGPVAQTAGRMIVPQGPQISSAASAAGADLPDSATASMKADAPALEREARSPTPPVVARPSNAAPTRVLEQPAAAAPRSIERPRPVLIEGAHHEAAPAAKPAQEQANARDAALLRMTPAVDPAGQGPRQVESAGARPAVPAETRAAAFAAPSPDGTGSGVAKGAQVRVDPSGPLPDARSQPSGQNADRPTIESSGTVVTSAPGHPPKSGEPKLIHATATATSVVAIPVDAPTPDTPFDPLIADPGSTDPARTLRHAGPAPDPAALPRGDTGRHVAVQVAESIRAGGDGRVEVTLRPEELGRVSLSFHGDGGAMTVSLSADRADTLDLLRRNIAVLEQELRDLGYDSLDFAFGDGGARDDQPDTRKAPIGPDEIATIDDATPDSPQTPRATRPGGGMDLRL